MLLVSIEPIVHPAVWFDDVQFLLSTQFLTRNGPSSGMGRNWRIP